MQNNDLKTRIVKSNSFNPWYNLAIEEYLLNNLRNNEVILYLWQNKNTVVVGKNQNPWRECRVKHLEDEGGRLARRLSGGGAVFHDLGNLNFTFLMNQGLYNIEKQLGVILCAVNAMGVNAEFTGRNDLTLDGRKFSGNAYYFNDKSAYHHGTIMVNADIDKMLRYLQVSRDKIVSKGIDSVRARVINLSEVIPDITIDETIERIKKSFVEKYGTGDGYVIDEGFKSPELQMLYEKYSSWEWRFKETPDFDIVLAERFQWGRIDIYLKVNDGRISQCGVYSDAMNPDVIEKIEKELIEAPYVYKAIETKLDLIETDTLGIQIINDIKNWFIEKI